MRTIAFVGALLFAVVAVCGIIDSIAAFIPAIIVTVGAAFCDDACGVG
jgi:hypothetical protein